MGDFNWEPIEESMSNFMELYDRNKLFRVPVCYENSENPSCVDLLLTNQNLSFQDTNAFEKGLPAFHALFIAVMKTYFRKVKTKNIR